MDVWSFAAYALSTVGVSAVTGFAAARWLSQKLIDHRLSKDLESYKAGLEVQLEREKSALEDRLERNKAELEHRLELQKVSWEGDVRQRVETALGRNARDLDYQLEARKRLYLAIGPLRFQLLLACRDLEGRVLSHNRDGYATTLTGYYGKSFLYLLLRPLALAELVERQIAYADFSVDSEALDLLRFRKNAFAAFTGGSLVKGHTAVNWDEQEQHVFYGNLSRAANQLIITDEDKRQRCMRYNEFEALLADPAVVDKLHPLPRLFDGFSPKTKPLFWLRLVAYAWICMDYVNHAGRNIGFEARDMNFAQLLGSSEDAQILAALPEYEARCRAMPKSPL